ncbi:MAG TPA: hypothetical protein VG733_03105 [Chthoniobacteraceae bacterium]|nr:hypothetical protein [Chthoniobacteraceae bacterium]
MKTFALLVTMAVILSGCDTRIKTTPAGEPDKVIEKKDTTIINPPATEDKKTETKTTESSSGTTVEKKTTTGQ